MKKLNKYRKSVQGLMLLTFGLTMAGCSAQDDFFTETSSESLSIKPSVTEATVSRAAVASVQALREAALDNLYVKIFDQEYKEQSVNEMLKDNLQSNKKEILGKGNWKVNLNLQENKDYFVYSIANANEDLTQVKSLADLETKVQTDADIWKPYSSDKNATKNFLMTANSPWTVSQEPTQTIDSKLTRAAAKIVVNLKINVEDYEVVGVPTWQLLNYNTQTTLFGPNTAKNIASMSETETMAKTADVYQLVTYSYATSWDDNASAPQAKIKVMLKKGDEKPVDYYYSIPVCDPKENKSLERNYVYTANATVTSLGSSSDITYGDAMDLVYDVQKWTKGEETTINAGDQKYLLVSPTFMIMKNQRFDNSTIKFYGSGKCTVETVEIYYYDKNGKKQSCSGSQSFKASANYAVGHDKLEDQGTIVIGDAKNTTNDFVPLSVKYIKIKVTCEGLEEIVTIKQYPLEYIQGIAGWYSTKDELNTYETTFWGDRYTGTTVGIDWQKDRTLHPNEKGSEDDHFFAKVKEPGDKYIYRYSDNRVSGKQYQAQKGSSTGDSNNRMYVVQITNTPKNSKYKIGHVTNIDKNTKLSSEDVVSPAFMLASQLGTVYAFTGKNDGKNASEHCDKYIEVNTDGKKYTNWRLPTASEIGVITNYQYNKNQKVIDVVLSGGSYWALNGNKVEANKNDDESGFVRCVRDLSPEEVKELENKKE